jgi:acyl-CoA thioesterase-2
VNSTWQWDQRDLTELLTLEPVGRASWQSYVCDTNVNGRVHGGQLLGQTLWAAAQTAEGRSPATLQMTFLQGAQPQESIEFSVESLQDGRRLSSRHIYGVQGTGLVLSANASFQVPQAHPGDPHRLAHPVPAPENLPTLAEACEHHRQESEAMQLRFSVRPLLDIRPIPPEDRCESPRDQRAVNYWIRLVQPLHREGYLHHAALAYLSASGLSTSIAQQHGMPDQWEHYYVSNLNHSLWFHSLDIDVTDWLLFVNEAVRSLSGRSLAMTHIYRRDGLLVASMAQDLLISSRNA